MNLNELNTLANNIRTTDEAARKTDFSPTIRYCVAKHNETIGLLKEVYEFVEKNFDLFDNPKIVWYPRSRNEQYHENFQIGTANPYNCVLRDFHHEGRSLGKNTRIYWVDEGIIFRIGKNGKVQFLTDCDHTSTHGYAPNIRHWNDSCDFTQFNYGVRVFEGDIRYTDIEPDWEKNLWKEDALPLSLDEFSITKFKEEVDRDFAHAEKVLERLTFTLKKVNDSVVERQKTLNGTVDCSVTKVAKYTIEISKIEG